MADTTPFYQTPPEEPPKKVTKVIAIKKEHLPLVLNLAGLERITAALGQVLGARLSLLEAASTQGLWGMMNLLYPDTAKFDCDLRIPPGLLIVYDRPVQEALPSEKELGELNDQLKPDYLRIIKELGENNRGD